MFLIANRLPKAHFFGIPRRGMCSLSNLYKKRVTEGIITHDPEQAAVLEHLGEKHEEICNYLNEMNAYWKALNTWQNDRAKKLESEPSSSSSNSIWSIFKRDSTENEAENLIEELVTLHDTSTANTQILKTKYVKRLDRQSWPSLRKELIKETQMKIIRYDKNRERNCKVLPMPKHPIPPKGIYLYGHVGTGKTMTMNLLFDSIQSMEIQNEINILNFSSKEGQTLNRELLQNIPTFSPFGELKSPQVKIIWSHFSDFLRNCYQNMHFHFNKKEKQFHGDIIDACISSFVGYNLVRDPPGKLSECLFQYNVEPDIELLLNRIPLPPLIIFFDEFQMIDIGDSTVVKRIFERLIRNGSIIITSCNLPPKHLLGQVTSHSEDIEEFTKLLDDSFHVVSLPSKDSKKTIDYRKHHYLNEKSSTDNINLFFDKTQISKFNQICNNLNINEFKTNYSLEIPNYNRSVLIPKANVDDKICYFDFIQLCSKELSSVDYNCIVKNFSVIIVSNIPQLSLKQKNEVRRFISLIDQMYNQQAILICQSEKEIDNLFSDLPSDLFDTTNIMENLQFERSDNYGKYQVTLNAISQFSGENEKFAFTRAQSRLKEMQTRRYINGRLPNTIM